MAWLAAIPCAAFILLLIGEITAGRRNEIPPHGPWDWVLNLSGFTFQGAVVPLSGYLLAVHVLPASFPAAAGVLPIGWAGAFLLNFVCIDFLYYWQHRWFHRSPHLWKLHRCHHSARRVDVWVTARNTVFIHFLFVYFLLNPVLGFLVTRPDAYFAGAMTTAALDLLRHSNLDFERLPGAAFWRRLLNPVLVLPSTHHRHHAAQRFEGNYGANLVIWDRLFDTLLPEPGYPERYGLTQAPHPLNQLLFPFRAKAPKSRASSRRTNHASPP